MQAAIWFFTDGYIISLTSPMRALTESIMADALANGPSAEPRFPNCRSPAEHAHTGDWRGLHRPTGHCDVVRGGLY